MADRHRGLTQPIATSYLEAARVCLDRHHTSPTEFVVQNGTESVGVLVEWEATDERSRGAWANHIDTTEAGAYACALATVELTGGLVAIRRAETGTGADYDIGPPDQPMDDLDGCLRLEVSATDRGTASAVARRLREKIEQGAIERSMALYRLAAQAEAHALAALDVTKTRTLGITAVSAVALWYKAGDYPQAQRIAHQWLSTDLLPPFAVEQLQGLLQTMWSDLVREHAGVKFTGGEVLVSVKGGEIVAGGAPVDLIVRKVEEVRALFYRTAELLIKAPHRKHGPPTAEIQELCRPWLFQAAPGSYQFVVRVQQPAQMDLFPNEALQIEKVATTLLQIITASADDPEEALAEVVPDPEYRATFLKLTRNLAPTGKGFGQLEVKPVSAPDTRPIILLPGSREAINHALKKQRTPPPDASAGAEVQLRGVLHARHLDQDWLEITIDSGTDQKPIRIYEAGETVDDVVGSMVNRGVIVDAFVTRDGRHLLRDIQAAE